MLTETIAIDRQTLEDTICDLTASKELLTRERDSIDNRIRALGERIVALQAKLDQAGRHSSGKAPRLRKGEGVAAILKVLNGPEGIGMSQAQISEKTEIPASTVFRMLKNRKNEDKFVLGPDNLWRKKMA